MPSYSKISLFLKDSDNHIEFNKRILDYLNDRYTILNDNYFTITIDVVDDEHLNDYVLRGLQSLPALEYDNEYLYGVNSILAALSKLEMLDNSQTNDNTQAAPEVRKEETFDQRQKHASFDSFHEMAMKEMQSEEQETQDALPTEKYGKSDFQEAPLNSQDIQDKMQKLSGIYEKRKQKHGGSSVSTNPNRSNNKNHNKPSDPINIEKILKSENYDQGESMFLRSIARNM